MRRIYTFDQPPLDQVSLIFELTPVRCTAWIEGTTDITCPHHQRHTIPVQRRVDIDYHDIEGYELDLVERVIREDLEAIVAYTKILVDDTVGREFHDPCTT